MQKSRSFVVRLYNPDLDPQPTKVNLRPIWYFRVLGRSLRQGEWIAPRVYMARAVWEQSDARVAGLPGKLSCCRKLLQIISSLEQEDAKYVSALAQMYSMGSLPPPETLQEKHVNDSVKQLLKKLDSTCSSIIDMQMELSRYLSFIPSPALKESMASSIFGKMKVLGDKLSGSEKTISGTYTEYLCLLMDIFDKSQFLEKWMNVFEKENIDIMDRLVRISSFLCNVVCEWLVRDCGSLIEQHLNTKEASLRRLF